WPASSDRNDWRSARTGCSSDTQGLNAVVNTAAAGLVSSGVQAQYPEGTEVSDPYRGPCTVFPCTVVSYWASACRCEVTSGAAGPFASRSASCSRGQPGHRPLAGRACGGAPEARETTGASSSL